jgi:gluconokinase
MILAIDIGTSSVRAALYDQKGALVKGTLVKNERRLRSTADGGSEIDADAAIRQTVKTIDSVIRLSAKIKSEITHVAACSFWHSLVGIDASGMPTTKVLSWADTRSREQVAFLRKKLDESATHNRTGARFHSSFWPAKILWIRETQPEVFERTAMWLSLSDYFSLRLCGSSATSVSMASATGIFDIRECTWDKPLIKLLKIKRASLPTIAADAETLQLTNRFAKRWPRLASVEWFPAIGDGAANNIGSGCTTTKRLGLMVGTSGAMRVAYRGEPPKTLPSGLWCYRIDRERVVVGGALSDGGGLFEWLQRNLDLPNNFEREIARRLPDQHGLSFLPFLAGERSTGYHVNANGAIIGLTSNTTALDIAQAAMESVGCRFAEIFDQINRVAEPSKIIASGGALRASRVWTQMLTDILGREITLVDVPEASLRGAVLLALAGFGNIGSIEEISSANGKHFVPNISQYQAYKSLRREHQRLYDLFLNKD